MKVVCINNDDVGNELTLGREYTAYLNFLFKIGYFSIENDLGENKTYKSKRFETVYLKRNSILDTLLS
jgi:hypothetical protein